MIKIEILGALGLEDERLLGWDWVDRWFMSILQGHWAGGTCPMTVMVGGKGGCGNGAWVKRGDRQVGRLPGCPLGLGQGDPAILQPVQASIHPTAIIIGHGLAAQ